jgi:hypothetical protein
MLKAMSNKAVGRPLTKYEPTWRGKYQSVVDELHNLRSDYDKCRAENDHLQARIIELLRRLDKL